MTEYDEIKTYVKPEIKEELNEKSDDLEKKTWENFINRFSIEQPDYRIDSMI